MAIEAVGDTGTLKKKDDDGDKEETKLEEKLIFGMPTGGEISIGTIKEVEEHLTAIGRQLPAPLKDWLEKVMLENITLQGMVQRQKDELKSLKKHISSVPSTDEIDDNSTKLLVENAVQLEVTKRTSEENVSKKSIDFRSLQELVVSLRSELFSLQKKFEAQELLLSVYHSLNDEMFELAKLDAQQFRQEVDYRALEDEVVLLRSEIFSVQQKIKAQELLLSVYHSLNDERFELAKVDSQQFLQESLKGATGDDGPDPKALNADEDTTSHTHKKLPTHNES